jgi:ascorbate-specific PTS system EIIC-type component UlaA
MGVLVITPTPADYFYSFLLICFIQILLGGIYLLFIAAQISSPLQQVTGRAYTALQHTTSSYY